MILKHSAVSTVSKHPDNENFDFKYDQEAEEQNVEKIKEALASQIKSAFKVGSQKAATSDKSSLNGPPELSNQVSINSESNEEMKTKLLSAG